MQSHLNKHVLGCWKIDLNKTCNKRFTTEAGRMKINMLPPHVELNGQDYCRHVGRRKKKPSFIQEIDSFNLKLCNQQKRGKIRREK